MVHALEEVHRVLKPRGILIDLRPGAEHRRIGLGEGKQWRMVGPLHETLDDDYAADAAIRRVVRDGLFREEKRSQFLLDRVMDTTDEVREWVADFDQRHDLPSHEPLLRQLEQQMSRYNQPVKISVRSHMTLGVLRKVALRRQDSDHLEVR